MSNIFVPNIHHTSYSEDTGGLQWFTKNKHRTYFAFQCSEDTLIWIGDKYTDDLTQWFSVQANEQFRFERGVAGPILIYTATATSVSIVSSLVEDFNFIPGEPEPEAPPEWETVPDFETTDGDGVTTYDITPYVTAIPPVTDWATNNPDVDIINGILQFPPSPDTYPIVVTATNAAGSTDSNEFTWERIGVVPSSLYYNPSLEGGSNIIDGEWESTAPDGHPLLYNTSDETQAEYIGPDDGTTGAFIFNEIGAEGVRCNIRLVFGTDESNLTTVEVGKYYRFSAEVNLTGYVDGTSDPQELRGININNNDALIINRDNADHSGTDGEWELCWVDFEVIGESNLLYAQHGLGVITPSSLVQITRNLSIVEETQPLPEWETIPNDSIVESDLPYTINLDSYCSNASTYTNIGTGEVAEREWILDSVGVGDYLGQVQADNTSGTETSNEFTITINTELLPPDWGTGIPDQSTDDDNWPQTLDLDDYCNGADEYLSDTGDITDSTLTVTHEDFALGNNTVDVIAINAAGSEQTSFTWERVGVEATIITHPQPFTLQENESGSTTTVEVTHPVAPSIPVSWQADDGVGGPWEPADTVLESDIGPIEGNPLLFTSAHINDDQKNLRVRIRPYGDATLQTWSDGATLTVEAEVITPPSWDTIPNDAITVDDLPYSIDLDTYCTDADTYTNLQDGSVVAREWILDSGSGEFTGEVEASNTDGDVPSNEFQISVTDVVVPPNWHTEIEDQSHDTFPQTIDLNDYCTGADGYLSLEGPGTIAGSIYTFPDGEDGGDYLCQVIATNDGGSVPSNEWTWTVKEVAYRHTVVTADIGSGYFGFHQTQAPPTSMVPQDIEDSDINIERWRFQQSGYVHNLNIGGTRNEGDEVWITPEGFEEYRLVVEAAPNTWRASADPADPVMRVFHDAMRVNQPDTTFNCNIRFVSTLPEIPPEPELGDD